MQSLYMYPEGSIWEISNAAVSGIGLLVQEVAVGTAEIFASMFYDTHEKRVHTISSAGAKRQALETSIHGAANEIKRYQGYENRDESELLESAVFLSYEEDGDSLYPRIELTNRVGDKRVFTLSLSQ